MTSIVFKWCKKPLPNKHYGDFKKVIYRRDTDRYECLICGQNYSKEEINPKIYKKTKYKGKFKASDLASLAHLVKPQERQTQL